jgi:hypothetical protein
MTKIMSAFTICAEKGTATKAQKCSSYSSTLSLTWALDRIGWLIPRTVRFTPGNDLVPILRQSGWTPGTVWTGAENLAPHWRSIPAPSSTWRVAIPTELSQATKFLVKLLK